MKTKERDTNRDTDVVMKIRDDTLLNFEGTFETNKNNFCYRVSGVLKVLGANIFRGTVLKCS
jgi:hypothetical protein